MSRVGRAAYFAAAPAVSLLLFWRVLATWFLNDDFAWLGKPLEVHAWGDLPRALFAPEAQGTVRFLSERLFFLVFGYLFGLHSLPYRIWVLATWFADLILANVIGARLTGSRTAGFLAAILWAASVNVSFALARVAAYNQILYSLCILLAFYARLRWIESDRRDWRVAEWAAYLAGFGALETVVMYPAIAALHALLLAPKKLRGTLPLFIPAGIFAALHFFFIPKNPGDYYAIVVDGRMPQTLLRYASLSLGPVDLGDWIPHAHWPVIAAVSLVAASLALFTVGRVRRREFAALFFIGWFLLLIAPVLPLPNHIFDYYVTLPELGFAWLAGWALATAMRSAMAIRVAAVMLAVIYVAGMAIEIDGTMQWYQDRSGRMRMLVLGLRDATRAHPNSPFFLTGVDNDLFQSGFQDDPFRLYGLQQVYLAPGSEQGIEARADLGGLTRWVSSPQAALHGIEHGGARVYAVSPTGLRDVTGEYQTILRGDPRASRIDFVDVGDASYAAQLGPTWYSADHGMRWMPKSAAVKMSGPVAASQRLYVTGYVPPTIVADGPITLTFRASQRKVGEGKITTDGPFTFDFALPAALAGQKEVVIEIETSRVLHPASDPRDFGAVFGTLAIR